MSRFTNGFRELAKCYAQQEIRYPHLKAVTLAQWVLESDGGKSALATEHLNFGGLKWRPEMAGFAEKVAYVANDGLDDYCKFRSPDAFIAGYWRFLQRSPYAGWEEHSNTPEDFIGFIGPIYCPPNPSYVSNVLSLVPEAETLLEETKD